MFYQKKCHVLIFLCQLTLWMHLNLSLPCQSTACRPRNWNSEIPLNFRQKTDGSRMEDNFEMGKETLNHKSRNRVKVIVINMINLVDGNNCWGLLWDQIKSNANRCWTQRCHFTVSRRAQLSYCKKKHVWDGGNISTQTATLLRGCS